MWVPKVRNMKYAICVYKKFGPDESVGFSCNFTHR